MATKKPRRHEAVRQVETHDYRGDGVPDHRGHDRCVECRLEDDHAVHRHELPSVDPDVVEVEQRITGERG